MFFDGDRAWPGAVACPACWRGAMTAGPGGMPHSSYSPRLGFGIGWMIALRPFRRAELPLSLMTASAFIDVSEATIDLAEGY